MHVHEDCLYCCEAIAELCVVLSRLFDYCCVCHYIIEIDVKFDYEFLSGLIIKIGHGGEISTSFLARSI